MVKSIDKKFLGSALLSGILFGIGLAISGMTDTAKVQGFLDLMGNWDITLSFVMGGALIVSMVCFKLVLKRDKPMFHTKFELPKSSDVDARLIIGASLFGAGWALVGYCPGPAIASLFYGYWQTALFVISMLAGAWLANLVGKRT